MIDIGVGISQERNPLVAAKEALKSAGANISLGEVDLAIVFGSVNLSSANLLSALKSTLGDIPIIGASFWVFRKMFFSMLPA